MSDHQTPRLTNELLHVVADVSLLRRPSGGTAHWIRGLIHALGSRADVDVDALTGPRRVGNGRAFRLPNMALQRWWYEIGINRAARRRSADVLLMPANLSARRSAIPQVVTVLDVNFLVAPGTYESSVVRYATWAWRRSLRDADAATTISRFSRLQIAEHLGVDPVKIAVVYPGLDPARPNDLPPPHPRSYALYVGATELHKNVGVLLDAWSAGRVGHLDLALVGRPGRDHAAIVRRAAAMSDRVTFRSNVNDAELESWYHHARVFVFPSLTEGFGYPPLEAMQRGLPVVAAAAGALPEILGDAARFHEPRDVDRIRDLVDEAAEDGRARSDLIAAGRARAATFGWASTAESMETILRGVAEPKSR